MVGYGALLTWIFKQFGVPLDTLQFPMSPNNKIGAKCLNNLHLRVSEKKILEDATVEDVENEDSNQEKEEKEKVEEDQKAEKEDTEPVPTTTHKEAEIGSQREQGEAVSEGETSKEDDGEALENDDSDDDSSDEEVRISVQKKPIVALRKSCRLASKGKRLVVSFDDDSILLTLFFIQSNEL